VLLKIRLLFATVIHLKFYPLLSLLMDLKQSRVNGTIKA
jgi:hypothetical protein